MFTKPFYSNTPSGIKPAGKPDSNYVLGKVGVIPNPEAPLGEKSQKIGAVVLSYNKAWMIQRFFASLEAQTKIPSQVVIVDDASTDGTQEMLRARFWMHQTVKLPKNRGQSYCRNVGSKSIKTDYIIFLDGDIEMKPHMLAAMEKALDEHPEVSIAYCHYNREGSRTDHMRAEPWNKERLLNINYISMISMIRRADMPEPPMDEGLKRYEDWDLWLRMMNSGKKGILIDDVLFTARYQMSDLSGSGESDDWRKIVEKKHRIGQ